MEKRRRARINNSLNELKTLILDAMKKDVSIYIIQFINLKLFKRKLYDGNLILIFFLFFSSPQDIQN